jgi:phage-related minor tail protein
MTKKIAVYGTYEIKKPVKQRFWKLRIDGIKQRYWKNTKRTKAETKKGRYEFEGSGKDLQRAVVEAQRIMPKDFIDITAEEFLKDPEKYGEEGRWIDREVDS